MKGRVVRCDVTELPVDGCAHCRRILDPDVVERREHARLLARPGWLAAVYPGTCERCGERFTPGTPIHMDVRAGWTAACCAGGNT